MLGAADLDTFMAAPGFLSDFLSILVQDTKSQVQSSVSVIIRSKMSVGLHS